MTLESLVDEIRRRGEAELAALEAAEAEAEHKVADDRDRRVAQLRADTTKAAEVEASRERAQRIAAAKLQARKLLYEAREQRLGKAIEETRGLLKEYASSPAYPATLERMVDVATARLGKPLRVMGRAEDASRLSKIAGKSFDPTAQPILGGLVAETADGNRRLNLSFDELLRLREDKVRELLS
jgi:V/A-type H+/Na+-transporting ATPase subunit E